MRMLTQQVSTQLNRYIIYLIGIVRPSLRPDQGYHSYEF